MLNILVTGKSGRMGQAIIEAIAQNEGANLGATHDAGENFSLALAQADAVIDFSHHTFTRTVLEEAIKQQKIVIIGTTGHSDEERAFIKEASEQIPVVCASNFSVGVNTLFWLTQKAAEILPQSQFDIEVTEMHHKHKIDAPSGTARTLLEILNQVTETSYTDDVAHGRLGNIGARKEKEIGMHTLRGGDVVGDHTVMFAADGERFELSHKASSRMTFASGSVTAAIWLQNQTKGLYDMQDVLGFKD